MNEVVSQRKMLAMTFSAQHTCTGKKKTFKKPRLLKRKINEESICKECLQTITLQPQLHNTKLPLVICP